jgi:hypothetical protein
MTAFKLVSAAAAMSSVLIVLAERDPSVPPAPVPDAINERWPDDPPAAPKADRLPLAVAAESLPAEVAADVGPEPVATVAPLPAIPTAANAVDATWRCYGPRRHRHHQPSARQCRWRSSDWRRRPRLR